MYHFSYHSNLNRMIIFIYVFFVKVDHCQNCLHLDDRFLCQMNQIQKMRHCLRNGGGKLKMSKKKTGRDIHCVVTWNLNFL